MLVFNASSVAVLWFGAHNVAKGTMQVGSLSAYLAYLIQILRHSEGHETEEDWETAAKAWDDLQMIPGVPGIGGGSGSFGIGG